MANNRNGNAPTESLSLTGTVKLHGTHADIRVHPDGRIIAQSRNNAALSAERDNFDFAKFCDQRHPAILRLAPSAAWEPIERYAAVADEPAALYNVGRAGFFRLALSTADRGAAFLAAARRLADEVRARCPFGAALGVEGPGEGIVWTPAAGAPNVPAFWLKTKGEGFEGRPSRVPAAPRDNAGQEAAAAFARVACCERRLEQGWDYLREIHIPRDMAGLPRFMA
ncbi:hypothetical protein UCRNP2_33 [Neofusicoccum parvum UCRNP2]|uniref:RNA ligase domain-containing protein n=1 Tax=Botryosphaeria parva (strain UCR-NP2) TaxID=1287680 RepID=R1GNA0_BOTPV|nr:hypothetical protein UCRNP2_33 [Neofusicoccum parvum UCRNP2]